MDFRLIYKGVLPANGRPAEKQAIRRIFHQQLAELWRQRPLSTLAVPGGTNILASPAAPGSVSVIFPLNNFQFAPLVTQRLETICHLDILFLRPEEPGAVITKGGDIDNRLKTLLDALRMPQNAGELPAGDVPLAGESPFFCLLEDDFLVTRINVTTDRLLESVNLSYVSLVLHVTIKTTFATFLNIGLSG